MATDPRARTAPDVLNPGVPATEEVPEEQLLTGDTKDVGDMPLGDQPTGVASWGTTANEEARGEPLEVRLMQEEPDVISAADDVPGQLLEPGAEDGIADTEATMVAEVNPVLEDSLAPEEAAMHVVDELPGGTTDAGPGYLDND